MKSKIQSILAGILIGIGAYAYVSISNLYIGAFIFSLGLISVFILEAKLFTGKIGNLNKTNWKEMVEILLFNVVGMLIVCLLAAPNEVLRSKCAEITENKMDRTFFHALANSIMCGIIIQLAVELKVKDNLLTTILCVMAFILCGFEHCIANIFYYICDGIFTWQAIIYFIIYILGNSIGAIGFKELIKWKL